MVWLANFFVSLAAGIITYFGKEVSKKTLFATAAVAAFVALTVAFVVAVKALAVGVVYALPAWAGPYIGMLLPTNLAVCLGALISARLALAIYRYHVETLKLVSYIT